MISRLVLWGLVTALGVCAAMGWTHGLLFLIALLLIEIALDVKHIRAAIVAWVQADLAAMAQEANAPDAETTSSDTLTGAAARNARYHPTDNDRAFAAMCEATGLAIHRVETGGDV